MTVLDTYIVFRYMNIFWQQRKVNKHILVLAYILYWMCIVVNSFGNIMSFVKTVLFNVSIIVLLACYFGSIGKRILAIAVINLLSIAAENISFMIGNACKDSLLPFEMPKACVENVLCEIFFGAGVLFVGTITLYKDERIKIPKRVLMLVLLVLGITLGIDVLFVEQAENNRWMLALFTGLVIILSILVIRYIQVFEKIFQEETKRKVFQQERLYYKKQLEWMEKKEDEIRQIRHDAKNHFIVLKEMMETGNVEKAKEHLQTVIGELQPPKQFSETGNICVDSLLNYKFSDAQKQKVVIIKKISIPEKLPIKDEDMVVVLGNLLDNAIEATAYLQNEEKKIWLILVEKKGMLFLHIKNIFDSTCLEKGGVLQTRKKDKTMHGFGLKSVERVVEQYGGIMKVEHVGHIFSVWIKIDLER